MNEIDFSALLCSRLCHDLISPVGAIANGIEILNDEDDEMMRLEVMKLLDQSAEVTANRLKFYRLSFGAAGGFGEKVPLSEAKNAIQGLYSGGQVNLTWQSDFGAMNKDAIKLMLNMVMVAGESLVRGGTLLVEIKDQSPNTCVTVTVHGDKVIFQDAVRKAILGDIVPGQVEAKSAPAYLAASVAQKLNTKVEHLPHNDQSFSLRLTYTDAETEVAPAGLATADPVC